MKFRFYGEMHGRDKGMDISDLEELEHDFLECFSSKHVAMRFLSWSRNMNPQAEHPTDKDLITNTFLHSKKRGETIDVVKLADFCSKQLGWTDYMVGLFVSANKRKSFIGRFWRTPEDFWEGREA